MSSVPPKLPDGVSPPALEDLLNPPLTPDQGGQGDILNIRATVAPWRFFYDTAAKHWRPVLDEYQAAPKTLADAARMTEVPPLDIHMVRLFETPTIRPEDVGRYPFDGCGRKFGQFPIAYDLELQCWRRVTTGNPEEEKTAQDLKRVTSRHAKPPSKRQPKDARDSDSGWRVTKALARTFAFIGIGVGIGIGAVLRAINAVNKAVLRALGGLWGVLPIRAKQAAIFIGIPALVVLGTYYAFIHVIFGLIGFLIWAWAIRVALEPRSSEFGGANNLAIISAVTFGVVPAIIIFFSIFSIKLLAGLF